MSKGLKGCPEDAGNALKVGRVVNQREQRPRPRPRDRLFTIWEVESVRHFVSHNSTTA